MSEYKYKSPIELIQEKIEKRIEGEIVKAVQNIGVNVDKDELLKALAYDRDQYNKGYHDAEPKVGKWKAKSFHECFCDNCGFSFDIMKCDFLGNMKHCPNCGAKMERRADERITE